MPRRPSRSLAQDVMDKVVTRITDGELVAGEKMPTELQMMRSYGVSRTVVREALSRLQAAGVVETRHGIGSFVLMPQSKPEGFMTGATIVTLYDVLDMLELRIGLETQAAGLAAVRRSKEHLERLAASLEDFTMQVRTDNNAVSADLNFHLLITQATGNPYFEEVYRFMGQNTIPRTRIKSSQYVNEPREMYLMRANQEHEAIFSAIERCDPESAQAAMHMHLVNSRERLRKVLEIEEAQV